MSLKRWLYLSAAAAFSLSTSLGLAQGHGNGNGHGNGHGKEKHVEEKRHEERAEDRHYYREHDRELHEWYRAHYSNLPPGLAKRDRLPPGLERQLVVRGTLPPGLQKKMTPCPAEVERYLPPPPVGYVHTVIGGNIVLVNRKTFFVLDVFHFEL
jgi:Ni/Co efflux regulator RcnB